MDERRATCELAEVPSTIRLGPVVDAWMRLACGEDNGAPVRLRTHLRWSHEIQTFHVLPLRESRSKSKSLAADVRAVVHRCSQNAP